MTPKLRLASRAVTPRTHGVKPRCVQTSGIFKLPAELIIGILSYFGDPHYNILRERFGQGRGVLALQHVERLTVIRKLTMTCWRLRNTLFPLLWQYVEGCDLFDCYPDPRDHFWMVPLKNGLYAQCSYLERNPTIGAYVQGLSIDIKNAPKDSITKFVDCLVRLPNLRTLEILCISHTKLVTSGLERNHARFPSIRELLVHEMLAEFIKRCPNVESVTVTGEHSRDVQILCSRWKELKRLRRIVGVHKEHVWQLVQGCPSLQEIGIEATIGSIRIPVTDTQVVEHLRSLKRLAVVDLDFVISPFYADETDAATRELYRTQIETDSEAWRRHLIRVLKDSPSKEHKFLRWKVYENRRMCDIAGYFLVVKEGGLEVLPETVP